MTRIPLLTAVLLFLFVLQGTAQEHFEPGPNSFRYPNNPEGQLTHHTWTSNIYPNTIRDYWIYVPAQYDALQAAALMVFQDGHTYLKADGDFRVPVVFDNLISQGKMPVTIGLFINPGHDTDAEKPENPFRATNRSVEYDEVSGTYARFLIEEIIPELEKEYNISADPKMRAICGLSSGGICAFSAAWFRPDAFHRVLSHIGSFTDIRGGHNYPSMIRKNDKKDIKVFLQDGTNDLDNRFGNWWLANLQMEAALKFKDFDYQFVSSDGAHDGKHGGAILPESLTWLWSDAVPGRVESKLYPIAAAEQEPVLVKGRTVHFSELEVKLIKLGENETLTIAQEVDKERMFIVLNGEIEVKFGTTEQFIGANSVAFLAAGETGTILSKNPESRLYQIKHQSAKPKNKDSDAELASFIINFDSLSFRPHMRGGVRNYFRSSTAQCSYYEMHVTTLNPGIKSHEPHTHSAEEFILMIEGTTEMEIGNEVFPATQPGDLYYAGANVPHAIRNTGTKPCMYFAFQWE